MKKLLSVGLLLVSVIYSEDAAVQLTAADRESLRDAYDAYVTAHDQLMALQLQLPQLKEAYEKARHALEIKCGTQLMRDKDGHDQCSPKPHVPGEKR